MKKKPKTQTAIHEDAMQRARVALAEANQAERRGARTERKRDDRAERILKAVNEQRGRLGVVVSLLQTLTIALEYGMPSRSGGPLWCEVSQLAANMAKQVNNSLDEVNIDPLVT